MKNALYGMRLRMLDVSICMHGRRSLLFLRANII